MSLLFKFAASRSADRAVSRALAEHARGPEMSFPASAISTVGGPVFLEHLLCHVPGTVLVIRDRLGTHLRRLVREFVGPAARPADARPGRIEQ